MENKVTSYGKYIWIILSSFIVFLIVLSATVKPPEAFSYEKAADGIQSFYASPEGYAAGCGNIFRAKNAVALSKEIPEEYYNIIPEDGYVPSGATIIPIYGYLSQRGMHPSQFKFYNKDSINKDIPESLILRTMYDNQVPIIWYDAETIKESDYKRLQEIGESNKGKVIIMPWLGYGVDHLPRDRTIAFAVFGMSQSCKTLDINVLKQFLSFTEEHGYDDKPSKPAIAELALPELL